MYVSSLRKGIYVCGLSEELSNLTDSSDPFMQMIRECDSGKSLHSIKRMACRFTAQLRRSLASDDKSQNLHRNASISVEGGF